MIALFNSDHRYTEEAFDFASKIRHAINDIMIEAAKKGCSPRDLHYLACTEVQDIVMDIVLSSGSPPTFPKKENCGGSN